MELFKKFYEKHQSKLSKSITKALDHAIENCQFNSVLPGLQSVKNSITKGKLTRGILVLLTIDMYGVGIKEEHYKLASALEIFHSGLLIHDDIIDHDKVRRGELSVYGFYLKEAEEKNIKDKIHYATSMAICMGDSIFFLAQEILNKSLHDLKINQSISDRIAKEMQTVSQTQMVDVSLGFLKQEPRIDDILKIYEFKTAHYSFTLPFIIGSAFSKKSDLKLFLDLGYNLGITFQIKDDGLGIFSDEEVLGKGVGNDIREDKKTIYRHFIFKSLDKKSNPIIESKFGKDDINKEDMQIIRDYILKNGIQLEVDKLSQIYSKKAGMIIKKLNKRGLKTDILSGFSDYLFLREK